MPAKDHKLSGRYYKAELTAVICNCLLFFIQYFGIQPSLKLPFLPVSLTHRSDLPKAFALILALALCYAVYEWWETSDRSWSDRRRLFGVILFSLVACWGSYSDIFAGSTLVKVSPLWYLGFAFWGWVIGETLGFAAFTLLMIRPKKVSQNLGLPSIPAAVVATLAPITVALALMIWGFFATFTAAPQTVHGLDSGIAVIFFVLGLQSTIQMLFYHEDSAGDRVPYRSRLAELQTPFEGHDRSLQLCEAFHKERRLNETPETTQRLIRDAYKAASEGESVQFAIELLDSVTLKLDPARDSLLGRELGVGRVEVTVDGRSDGKVSVMLTPADENLEPKELEVPTTLVSKYASKFLLLESEADLDTQAVIEYAIKNSVHELVWDLHDDAIIDAANIGSEDSVKALLANSVDANHVGEGGWTPLLASSAQGYTEIMRMLLDAGANPDISNSLGITPLMFGSRYKRVDVASLLLEYGANPNIQDFGGDTALSVAARYGANDVVELLLRNGADVELKNHGGKSALDVAYDSAAGGAAKLIRKAIEESGNCGGP